ncbi:unnamed protein product [Protopolystoma xenopodis]|uniref:Secreted protein n=1 Tax=Protopolystoma xenopodis TaxID=117903 RepID=A0A448XGZ8_9PLAT|nr:unnamed protein product [Protopolystoma xenopodis]
MQLLACLPRLRLNLIGRFIFLFFIPTSRALQRILAPFIGVCNRPSRFQHRTTSFRRHSRRPFDDYDLRRLQCSYFFAIF